MTIVFNKKRSNTFPWYVSNHSLTGLSHPGLGTEPGPTPNGGDNRANSSTPLTILSMSKDALSFLESVIIIFMMKRFGDFFLDILEVVVSSFAIFLFIYLLVMQPHKIKGASMEPNFFDGEYLITDKLTYRFKEPKRGDVIVFEAPVAAGEEYIKRIIGLPGEKVSIKDGHLYINDKVLNEPYIPSSIVTKGVLFLKNGDEKTVPQDSYFVVGDNRPSSSDSRYWGYVSKNKITGRAFFIYWPVNKMGLIKFPQPFL